MPPDRPPPDARPVVDRLLQAAVDRSASDVHVEPVAGGNYEVRHRVDGLLEPAGTLDPDAGRAAVGRLMVMAGLLTYRLDVPQEGRIAFASPPHGVLDLRLAVMPTAHGLRAVVRLPAELTQPRTLKELGLPASALDRLQRFAAADQGMLLVTGPAGSGKTTTIYALLRHIAEASPGLSIITLEDPIERHVAGVTQIEVKPFSEMTYARALRSILRQDPQVLMLGEVRDAATAQLAVEAALSGHRLVCTLHAGTTGGAVDRLLGMGVEPYQVTSSLFGVVAQRLLRRRPAEGAAPGTARGRVVVAEVGLVDDAVRRAVLAVADAGTLTTAFQRRPGSVTMRAAAEDLVGRGVVDAAEVRRVLGEEPAEQRGGQDQSSPP